MPSQRSTAVLITQQLINNKHHKRKFKLPLIISFDIHSNAFAVLLWNSFWHLHRRLHGMRVFIYSLFVCTFLDVLFSFFNRHEWWIWSGFQNRFDLPPAESAHPKMVKILRHFANWERSWETASIFAHYHNFCSLWLSLACCVLLTFPFQSRSLTASSLCLCSYASCFLQVSIINFCIVNYA